MFRRQGVKKARGLAGGLAVIFLAVVVAILARSVLKVYERERIAASNRDRARIEHDALAERKKFLETAIGSLDTDHGVEKEIRKKYDVARPGEEIIVVLEPEKASTSQTAATGGGMMRQFLDFFR